MNLRGRVHVVTGANSGIGREVQMTWLMTRLLKHNIENYPLLNTLRTVC